MVAPIIQECHTHVILLDRNRRRVLIAAGVHLVTRGTGASLLTTETSAPLDLYWEKGGRWGAGCVGGGGRGVRGGRSGRDRGGEGAGDEGARAREMGRREEGEGEKVKGRPEGAGKGRGRTGAPV